MYKAILSIWIICLLPLSTAFAVTVITGEVTDMHGESVKLTYRAHEIAGPAKGDQVNFSTVMSGITVFAGSGVVSTIAGKSVWVTITESPVDLGMAGNIQATGEADITELVEVTYKNYQSKKDLKNYKLLETYANKGNAQAQYYMGVASFWLSHDKSKNKNNVENKRISAQWLQRASDQGHVEAMLDLGFAYEIGMHSKDRNIQKAYDYYSRAAKNGYIKAVGRLGRIHLEHDFIGKNAGEGLRLLKRASDKNDMTSMNLLAHYYRQGRSFRLYGFKVGRDLDKAINLYKKSAQLGSRDAKKALKRIKIIGE